LFVPIEEFFTEPFERGSLIFDASRKATHIASGNLGLMMSAWATINRYFFHICYFAGNFPLRGVCDT
jgi:hypothetical protein